MYRLSLRFEPRWLRKMSTLQSLLLFLLCLVQQPALGRGDHDEVDGRDCPLGWTTIVEGSGEDSLCVKVFTGGVSWQEASDICNDNYAHLAYFEKRTSRNLESFTRQIRKIMENAGIENSWMSMVKQHTSGKLWWMAEQPEPVRVEDTSPESAIANGFAWGSNQPNDNIGQCGAFWKMGNSSTVHLYFGLKTCSSPCPFTCMAEPIKLQNTMPMCPSNQPWYYDGMSKHCFLLPPTERLTYDEASAWCKKQSKPSLHAILVTPNVPHIANLTVNIMRREGVTSAWIGLSRDTSGQLVWSSGALFTDWQSHVDPTQGSRCFNADLTRTRDPQMPWAPDGCSNKQAFVCQMPADSTAILPDGQQDEASHMTLHPADLTLTSDDLPAQIDGGRNEGFDWTQFPSISVSPSSTHTFSCNVSSWYPGSHVTWVKDGAFIDNGPAPQGLTLTLDRNFLTALTAVQGGQAHLDGRYHCLVWGEPPYRRLASKPALLKLTDVVTLRLFAPIAKAMETFPSTRMAETKLFNSRLLYGREEITSTYVHLILEDVVRMEIAGKTFMPDFVVDRIRSDGETMDLSLRYKLPTTSREGLEVLIQSVPGLTTRGGDLLQRTAQAFYNKLRDQLQTQAITERLAPLDVSADQLELRTVGFCPMVTTVRNGESLVWNASLTGKRSGTTKTCFFSGQPVGSSLCSGDYVSGSHRTDFRYYDTVDCAEPPKSRVTDQLKTLSQTVPQDDTQVKEMGRQVVTLTSDPKEMTFADVAYSARVLETLAASVNRITDPGTDIGMELVEATNNLLLTDKKQIRHAQIANRAADRVLHAIETYASQANLNGKNISRIVQSKMALEIWEIPEEDRVDSRMGFGSRSGFGDEDLSVVSGMSGAKTADSFTSSIVLPEEVLQQARKSYEMLRKQNPAGDQVPHSNRVTFTMFTTDQLFVTETNREQVGDRSETDEDRRETDITDGDWNNTTAESNKQTNSMIISASVNGVRITNLTEPIETVFKPRRNVSHVECVYWEFGKESEEDDGMVSAGMVTGGGWSSEGCEYKGRRGDQVVCHCNHLTNFAILMDLTQEDVTPEHLLALTMITYIGLILSIIGLMATIVSFCVFRTLRKGRGQKVLVNLAVALLCVNITFAAGIMQTDNEPACATVAALLLYFLLVSFLWMLVEGVLQYLRFVKVLDTYVENFMLKAALPAWLLPTLPVIVIAAYDWTLLRGHPDYCWLSLPAFYYGFMIPVALIMVANVIIFILIIKGITCDRPKGIQSNQSDSEMAWLQLKAAVCCFVVLGLTWLFGFLAVADARLPFQYLFCLFNAFQGLFIFLLHTIREPGTRKLWYKCCCPHLYARDHTSSSSGASRSNSTAGTGYGANPPYVRSSSQPGPTPRKS